MADPTTLGAYLTASREASGLSAEEVAARTRIATRFIRLLEEDLTVTLGNAGVVRLELDGRSLPALGTTGEIVRDVVIPGESEAAPESGS